MEEEVENKDHEADSSTPHSGKKYTTIWRNKWITSKAGSIDDFIKAYEGLAEMMKRWKSEGIELDSDIIASVGDDYAQFCTYDEKVAIKEGFGEDTFEEEIQAIKNDSFEDWDDPIDSSILEFSINTHLSLKKIKC